MTSILSRKIKFARDGLFSVCAKCRIEKPRSEYHSRPDRESGIHSHCKVCRRAAELARHRGQPAVATVGAMRRRSSLAGIPFDAAYFTPRVADMLATAKACACCGVELSRGVGRMRGASPTLDRMVDAAGYVPGNVAVVCRDCNAIKQNQRSWWKIQKVADYVAKIQGGGR